MMGELDIQHKITLAAGVYRTQLLVQFQRGMIGEDEFFNLY